MPIAQTMLDPLSAFMAATAAGRAPFPCPLVATRYDVVIDAGLAVVTMARTFRNAEAQAIEATITFPVPVHAVLYGLEVRIGDRVLKAHARRKEAARQHYEEAIDRGKTAVLHEEVLRGVHMLSVGQVAPGAELEVRATWAATLTNVGGHGRLRIPLTVGDVYGHSGLPDSDALIHGGPQQRGTLTVDCRDGVASLLGGQLKDRQAEIALNAPIDIDVAGWTARPLHGRCADGRSIALTIEPHAGGEAALDVALVLDHSGSMGERCSALQSGFTKHAAVQAAIEALAARAAPADVIDLWQFNNAVHHVGSTRNAAMRDLVRHLAGPSGGTEIGGALAGVLAGSSARDILLVTDGKSYALDVQALARAGRRVCVVLVGADSLEAQVGHLAALTGGEIFVAAGGDLEAVLEAAIRSLRAPHVPARLDGDRLRQQRAGMTLTATWQAAGDGAEATLEGRAVAAVAASLLLPTLPEEAAGALAEAEGLVTHLVSLVLVDEESAAQTGIPATRKIALPTPDNIVAAAPPMAAGAMPMVYARRAPQIGQQLRAFFEPPSSSDSQTRPHVDRDRPERARRSLFSWLKRRPGGASTERSGLDLDALSRRIPWDRAPQRLQSGDISDLDADVAQAIRRLATEPIIVRAARDLGCDPIVLVIALLARAAAARERTAARVARAILGERPTHQLEAELAQHRRDPVPG